MHTKFIAAAQAIADHFTHMVARRGEPFSETFIDPMNNDAVKPNVAGIPVTLLNALVGAQIPAMFLADGVTSNPDWLVFKHNVLNPDATAILAGAPQPSQSMVDAERFVVLADALLKPDSEARAFFERAANEKEPTSINELRAMVDDAIRLQPGGAA